MKRWEKRRRGETYLQIRGFDSTVQSSNPQGSEVGILVFLFLVHWSWSWSSYNSRSWNRRSCRRNFFGSVLVLVQRIFQDLLFLFIFHFLFGYLLFRFSRLLSNLFRDLFWTRLRDNENVDIELDTWFSCDHSWWRWSRFIGFSRRYDCNSISGSFGDGEAISLRVLSFSFQGLKKVCNMVVLY